MVEDSHHGANRIIWSNRRGRILGIEATMVVFGAYVRMDGRIYFRTEFGKKGPPSLPVDKRLRNTVAENKSFMPWGVHAALEGAPRNSVSLRSPPPARRPFAPVHLGCMALVCWSAGVRQRHGTSEQSFKRFASRADRSSADIS